jgi:NADH:ubiquinone oxidoreductase subunit E
LKPKAILWHALPTGYKESALNDKIRVTVCTGTTCYVMGGAELLALEEGLPERLAGKIELEGATCLGRCHDRGLGNPPFALVDGQVVAAASVESLVEAIDARLAARAGEAGERA